MRRDQTSDLKGHTRGVHEQRRAEHAEGDELGRNSEEVEASLLSTLVLHRCVAEGKGKPLQEEDFPGEVDIERLQELATLPIQPEK